MSTPTRELESLTPSAVIELFMLDTTALGGTLYRFHAGTNGLKQPIVWQGNTYQNFPIQAEGFEWNGKGQVPRPVLRVANVTGLIGLLCLSTDDLLGATVTRKRTFAKYLDADNFSTGNPAADPTAEFPEDIYAIDRRSLENKYVVEFELASPLDALNVLLPRRQVIANVCTWRYRSAECGYAGGAVAKNDDTPTSDPNQDRCGKRIVSCGLRFGNDLPFGGFPAAGLIR